MAGTRRAYRWRLTFDDPLMAGEVCVAVADIITAWTVAKPKIFSDGWMAGQALGIIDVGVVITRRDQWETHRRALQFARALAVRSHVSVKLLRDPEPATLPPHDHRGRRMILAPKYAEVDDGTQADPGGTGEPVQPDIGSDARYRRYHQRHVPAQ